MAIPASITKKLTAKQCDLVAALAVPGTTITAAAKKAGMDRSHASMSQQNPTVSAAIALVKQERLDKAQGEAERLRALRHRLEAKMQQLLDAPELLSAVEVAGLFKTLIDGERQAREMGLDAPELTEAQQRKVLWSPRLNAAIQGARMALRYGERALARLKRLQQARR